MNDMRPAEQFEFSDDNRARAERIAARYPDGRQQSAVIALLDMAQRQNGGWLSQAAISYVADHLEMPRIRALEVATFYTMFNLEPVGRHQVQVCRTTPCWLRGANELAATALDEAGCGPREISADGAFTVIEVECLGACCNAPMVQIGDDYYEDLTPEKLRNIMRALRRGEIPPAGPQDGRVGSEPAGGLTTLTDAASPAGAE